MVEMVVFINLFFVPMLPLYVIHKERQTPLQRNLDLLFLYGILAACNIPLTKAFIFSIKEISGIRISIDSGYYTVAAFFPTILVTLLYKFYKTYPDHDSWKEKIIQKGIKGVAGDLAPACVLLFASCFMLFLFEPILMYATNMNDFWFDFQIMIGPVLRMFSRFLLIGIVIIFLIYNADLLISKRLLVYKGIILTGFIVFFLLYLQGNWLAGNLPALDGEEIIWENYGKHENLVLMTAMAILAISLTVLIRKRGINRTVFYAITCTSIVFVMLFVSLLPTVIINRALDRKETFSATLKNFNTISTSKNFLIFLVDTTNSKTVYDLMMGDDDFSEMMEDFTYYPDTLSVYPYTRDSIPNILTGTVYRNETGYLDYGSSAYNQSPLFEKLTQNGYGINLYSVNVAWNGERKFNIENSASIHDDSLELTSFMIQELKYIAYKYLPYGLKQYSKIESLDFDTCRIVNSGYGAYTWKNKTNYKRITENSILDKQSNNYFQFVHVEGSHAPYNIDKDLNSIEGGTYEQKAASALTLIKAYLQRLKDNDVYDNSVIVIMADHGQRTNMKYKQPYKYLGRCNPILFIKGINERHEMLESDRAVSYVELNNALCELIDGKQSTELFSELEPGRRRTVLWQVFNEEYHKVEYETTGKAWELEKFIPTGNVYDLNE